jgi:hypothetical protein
MRLAGSKSVEVQPAVDSVQRLDCREPDCVGAAIGHGGRPGAPCPSTTAATTDRVSINGARESVTQSVSVGVIDSALRLR